MKTYQSVLQDRFEWVEALHIVLTQKIITLHDYWLLTGNHTILKELPSVEDDLPADVKENLTIQRLLARQNFRGVVASAPVVMLRWFKEIFVNATEEFGKSGGGL